MGGKPSAAGHGGQRAGSGGSPASSGSPSYSSGGTGSGLPQGGSTAGGVSQGAAGAGGTPPSTEGGGSSTAGSAGTTPANGGASGAPATAGTGGAGAPGSAGAPAGGRGPTTGMTDPNNGASGAARAIGFAAVAGMGVNDTTGGVGGRQVTATTFEDLAAYLDSDEPLIIFVQGTIDLGGMVPMRSNKTLIGLASARLVNGGLEMNRRQNIIVRNITFADGTDDTFKINQNTHHVWVDHCDFTNSADGLFDITRQSSYITISWNKFYEHSKTMLIGHSDAETGDVGHLKTTIHHNWFNGSEQRHPRVRFGEVHVFNNYFLNNRLYGVASTMEAEVVVEGNVFEGVAFPIYSGYDASAPGDVVERNNLYIGSGLPQTRGMAFDPGAAYTYVVENPSTLAPLLRSKTGVGVIDPVAAAR